MTTATKMGQRIIRIANRLISTMVLVAILLLLAFGSYALWDSGQVHNAASHRNYERYNPTLENNTASFAELQAINPDVFAWLTIFGTNIDYPVVQGQDNLRYVNTNANGQHSLSGAIFLDANNGPGFSDFSSILYGHHMERQAMFGEIGLFAGEDYFNARRYGMLYENGREYGLTFFAFVHADAYDTAVFRTKIEGPADQQAYLDLLRQLAIHTREEISVTPGDRIVLLSTCSDSSTNGRDILIGKITYETQSNPFGIEEEADHANPIPSIDLLPGQWSQAVLWVKMILIVLLIPLIVWLVMLICINRKCSAVEAPFQAKKEDDDHA